MKFVMEKAACYADLIAKRIKFKLLSDSWWLIKNVFTLLGAYFTGLTTLMVIRGAEKKEKEQLQRDRATIEAHGNWIEKEVAQLREKGNENATTSVDPTAADAPTAAAPPPKASTIYSE